MARKKSTKKKSDSKSKKTPKSFLIYGSNGYTGSLIVKLAADQGMDPILAGRSIEDISFQAREYGFEHSAFSLEMTEALIQTLEFVDVVLHCAGPFAHTSKQMVDACIQSKTHYLDLTGEAAVFEAIAARDEEAKEAGVMLLPGVGFDVVPTDCMSSYLKTNLPEANRLTLAIHSTGGIQVSRGTATTMAENVNKGGLVRRDGELISVPAAWKSKMIDFGEGPQLAVTIPWGDVVTAYYSTGIPNIEVYFAASESLQRNLMATRFFGWFLGLLPVQSLIKRKIASGKAGPTDEERSTNRTCIWGEVEDEEGNQLASRIQAPDWYTLTSLISLSAVKRIFNGQVKPGFQTPSLVFGHDFILEFADVVWEDVET